MNCLQRTSFYLGYSVAYCIVNKWEILKTLAVLVFAGLVLQLMLGCATPDPYLRVGVHHLVNPGHAPNPAFMGELGVQWDKTTCQYTHLSMITEGSPWNNRPEISLDAIGCSYTFGGK